MEQEVCICGAGTMGRGIALAMASKGVPAILYDLNSAMISTARNLISQELLQAVEKKRIRAADKEKTLENIFFTSTLQDCVAPLVIEAIIENPEAKTDLFLSLEKINKRDTLFATNTSSLSVTAIAEKTHFPERIIGLHFFNPANRMKLVEIIRTKYTPEKSMTEMQIILLSIGKTTVVCMDTPGFIVNRVARPFYIEALRIAEENNSDFEHIDRLMESAGFKMGPFHLMDLIGNDINYTVSWSVYEALGKPARLKPSRLQEANVKKGALGKKTGSGFFEYTQSVTE